MSQYIPQNDLNILFPGFAHTFAETMEDARLSGAIPDGATDVEIARCVLQIVAEKYAPVSKSNQRLLKNLRHFI